MLPFAFGELNLRVHKQEALLVIQMVWVMGKLEGNSFGGSVGEFLD